MNTSPCPEQLCIAAVSAAWTAADSHDDSAAAGAGGAKATCCGAEEYQNARLNNTDTQSAQVLREDPHPLSSSLAWGDADGGCGKSPS